MTTVLGALAYVLGAYLAMAGVLAIMAAAGIGRAAFYYRALMSYLLLGVCAAYGGTAAFFLRFVGLHRISQWLTARAYKHSMGLATRIHFDIVAGKQFLQTRPTVFVGNHQTALDVLLLGEIFPKWCSVTAKTQLKMIPVFGWYLSLSGTVFIDRGNRNTAIKAFAGAAADIRDRRQSVFIFPEGTRSNAKDPMLLPFKKGAFHLALQAKAPITPVVSACYSGVLAIKERRFRQGRIPVVVLAPIPTSNLAASDVDELTLFVRDLMLYTLDKLSHSKAGLQAWQPDPSAPVATHAHALPAPVPTREEAVASMVQDGLTEARRALLVKLGMDV